MKNGFEFMFLTILILMTLTLGITQAMALPAETTTSQENRQPSGSSPADLQESQERVQSQVDMKNATLSTNLNTPTPLSPSHSLDGVIENYNIQKSSNFNPKTAMAINEAYDNDEPSFSMDAGTINFTSRDGERITKDELSMVINSLQTMPGTSAAPSWKVWTDVRMIGGKYYWQNAPDRQREMNPIDAQLYAQWKKSPLAASLFASVVENYNFQNPVNITLEDALAIKQAYESGRTSASTSTGVINFIKKNGERLDKNELNMITDSLQAMVGTSAAPYWKTWDSVRMVDGKYYWMNAPGNKKEMNNMDIQLYLKRKELIK